MEEENFGSTASPSLSSYAASVAEPEVLGYPGIPLKECQEIIHKNLTNPKVKILIEKLEKCDGAKLRSNYITAIHCNQLNLEGYYFPSLYRRGRGIKICSENMKSEDMVVRTMIHELVHAYDDCRGNLRKSTAHVACSEIRAYRLSGECHMMKRGGFLHRYLGFLVKPIEQQARLINMQYRKKGAIGSLEGIDCSPDEAKAAVEDIWSRCYDDLAPFGKDI